MLRSLLALVVLAAVAAGQKPGYTFDVPNEKNFRAWRDHILPTPAEIRWETIPWQQSFGAGLRAASQAGKPLLLYAMNGHPLGCT